MEGVITYDRDMIKVTAENYSYRNATMEDHLICKGIARPIFNQSIREGKNENKQKLLNRKAVAII